MNAMQIDVEKLSRVEVITEAGRQFTWWRNWPGQSGGTQEAQLQLQDDGRTLKIFIKEAAEPKPQYDKGKIYGDVMTVEEFRGGVESGGFTDWDGHGHPVKDNMEDIGWYVFPSEMKIPADATHIAWYNK